jgi:hypothetical protein
VVAAREICPVFLFVWFNQTIETNKVNQMNQSSVSTTVRQ